MSVSSIAECNNKAASLEALSSQAVKAECEEAAVKQEPLECVVCAARSLENYDIYQNNTATTNVTFHDFVRRFTNVDIVVTESSSKHVCKSCFDLINVLDEAEAEYNKLKEAFEAIISKNPLFEVKTKELKSEVLFETFEENHNDSEDEPLALTRKKREKPQKVVKAKKKSLPASSKRKIKIQSDSWECGVCGKKGTGGLAEQSAHHLSTHVVAAEATDSPGSPPVKRELDDDEDDEDDDFPDFGSDLDDSSVDFSIKNLKIKKECKKEPSAQRGRPRKKDIGNKIEPTRERKRRPRKTYSCDQCSITYTSQARLDEHKQEHGSKSPYICEICGARYKHKKACDIHVALHKGISDWKCEECNKLFPSKCALRRHNNIHTGKTNYQCDLCGKSFIHTSSFKMHKLSHSGVKAHACGVCGLALMTRSHLKRHARVHSGEKRHQCPLCGKRFSERYNLIAHSKSHAAPVAAVLVPAPRRRLFRCPYCPERYERKYMLENHVSSSHGRTLERGPPTPRNTMSKLLKQQAQQASQPPAADSTAPSEKTKVKSPAPDTPTPTKLTDPAGSPGAWYPAEFPTLRADFAH